MKIAIVGSRAFPNRAMVRDFVSMLPPNTVIVSGGAAGVDLWAQTAAEERGLTVEVFLPDWLTYGQAAGAVRNRQIVEAADGVVAFWDGHSKGTKITIDLATRAGKLLSVMSP